MEGSGGGVVAVLELGELFDLAATLTHHPEITRALRLLIDELNTTRPASPATPDQSLPAVTGLTHTGQ